LTAWQLKWFAKATGETNPIYFDEEAAKKAGCRACWRHRPSSSAWTWTRSIPSITSKRWAAISARCCTANSRSPTTSRSIPAIRSTFDGEITDIYDKKNGALQFVVKDVKVRRQGELVCDVRSVMVFGHRG
jgi:hypothetical protein